MICTTYREQWEKNIRFHYVLALTYGALFYEHKIIFIDVGYTKQRTALELQLELAFIMTIIIALILI